LALAVLLVSACSGEGEPSEPASVEDPGPGAEYHVAQGGPGGADGSAARPFGTIEQGLTALGPGDTLLVAGGTYDEQIRDPEIRSGTSTAPINVRAVDGERVVLRGLLWLEDASWWTIDGIDVTWSDDNGADEHMVKFTGGTGWTYTNAEVWGAESYAAILVARSPRDFTLSDLYVHDTRETNGTNQDHLIYLNSGDGGGVVERCLLQGSPNGRAIKIGSDDDDGRAVSNVSIRFNTMIDNLGPSNVQLAYGSSDNVIERNIMVGAGEDRGNVTTYKLSGDANVVRQNVGWDSTGVLEEDDRDELDGGGNLRVDPELDDEGRPRNRWTPVYGHLAPAS